MTDEKTPNECLTPEEKRALSRKLTGTLVTLSATRLRALTDRATDAIRLVPNAYTMGRAGAIATARQLAQEGGDVAIDAMTLSRLHSAAVVGWEYGAYVPTASVREMLVEVEGKIREVVSSA